MTPPDHRDLVAQARQHAAIRAAFGGDTNGELLRAFADALSAALDRAEKAEVEAQKLKDTYCDFSGGPLGR